MSHTRGRHWRVRRYHGVGEKGSRADTRSLRTTDDGVVIPVRVIPRSSRTRVDDWRDGRLLVRLTAAPVEGAANEALIRLLAKELKVPRCAVRIVTGGRAREKHVLVEGVTAEQLLDRLTTLAPPVSPRPVSAPRAGAGPTGSG